MRQIFNLKSYLTFLSRNRVYTAINVFGLSVSLMFVILLTVYVQQEYTVDHQQAKLDRISALGFHGNLFAEQEQHSLMTNRAFGPALQKLLPEVEATCSFYYNPHDWVKAADAEKQMAGILYVDSTFYRVFDFPLVKGDPAHVLDNPAGVVINEELARRLFGEHDPMGRRLHLCRYNSEFAPSDSRLTVVVTGVFRTMGNTAMQTPDLIAQIGIRRAQGFEIDNLSSMGNAVVLLLSKPGTTLEGQEKKVEKAMQQVSPTFFQSAGNRQGKLVPDIVPLRKVYFDNTYESFVQFRKGDARQVRIFGLVVLVILLFSVMNYVNLTVALSGYRAREMATRRLFGSQRSEIVMRLILESVVLCALSLAIGLGLALWLTPYMEKLLDTKLHTELLLLLPNVALIMGVVLSIGILAGVAPAVIQSRAKPIEVVRGTFRKTTRMLFSRVFIIIQNVITIALIAAALTIWLQVRHLVSAPLGYDTHGIMCLNKPNFESSVTDARRLRDALLKLPCVERVSICDFPPLMNGGSLGTALPPDNRPFTFTMFNVDEEWLPLLGIPVKTDYRTGGDYRYYMNPQFMQGGRIKASERTLRAFPMVEDGPIGGLVEDFKMGNILNTEYAERPKLVRVYHNLDAMPWWGNCLVKVKGNELAAYRQVSETYKEVFGETTNQEPRYLDQMLESQFEDQSRLLRIVTVFAALAVLISLLGLIAMSTYFIQQRRKEIAIRKVYGSTSRQMWVALVRTFLVYVAVAFVLAVPVVRHFMSDWLSGYSYRIALSWWIFALAGLFGLTVSFVAVAIQSYAASNENPIEHIKDNG